MATTTTNLGLTLPAVSDPADITPINENFQKLDAKVGLNARSTDAFAYQNASLTDLLMVRLDGNFDDLCMSHTHISTEDASTLKDSPITSGAFYAIRRVSASPVGHVFVTLEEFYPVRGRVWVNMYDKNYGTWLGWQEQNTSDLSTKFAPAGYGLGGNGTYTKNLNECKMSGWRRYDASAEGNPCPGYDGLLTVHASNSVIKQVAEPGGYKGVPTLERKMLVVLGETTYREWEWVNPPMALGVEYRTTERWEGKAVYTKLVDFGALPNTASKSVYAGVSGATGVIGYEGVTANAANDTFCDMSMFPAITGSYANLVSGNINIVLTTDRDATHLTAKIKIRYVKS